MSQLELATRADMSQRHLSFIETGRARPGAEVVERVASVLDVPLRDRNRLLAAAGLAPRHPELPLDDVVIAPFRSAVRRLLAAHDPYPAFVLDRWWDVVDANAAARRLFPAAAGGALPNAVEAFLAPGGMRQVVVNFPEVASMYLRRLQAEVAEGSDERLQGILQRARDLLADVDLVQPSDAHDLVICPKLRLDGEIIGTITMVARFGATREVTLDELRVELIYPADEAADAYFRRSG
jgi:transcriptional regulator with XRE-family HTH domain